MNLKGAILGLGALALAGLGLAVNAQEATRPAPAQPPAKVATAWPGGCFWCMEPPFDKIDGVLSTTSGYTGGTKPGATYYEVSAGGTGHYEAVRIVYDPQKVSYDKLLEVFWRNHDPFDATGQFCDKGESYLPAVFVHDEEQRRLAEASKASVASRFPEPVATEIKPAAEFYVAEDYHQDYYIKSALKYKYYRYACGRDARLQEIWGKPGA